MVLKIPNKKNIFDGGTEETIEKEKKFSIGRLNGTTLTFSIGLGVDTSMGALVINVGAIGSGNKAVGFKTTRIIHNQIGVADNYDYKIENITKGTTLVTVTAHTLADQEFTTVTEVWTLDQIGTNDAIRYSITDGIIGTNAGRATLGFVSFFLESIDEEIIT